MKTLLIVFAALCMALAVSAQTKTKLLTTDLLTGLPLNPATDPGMNLGNEPTAMPGTTVCKSKIQAQYYSLFYITTGWRRRLVYGESSRIHGGERHGVGPRSGYVLQARWNCSRDCDRRHWYAERTLRRLRTLHARTFGEGHCRYDSRKYRLSVDA
jgi:hypothetical protein